MGHSTPITNNNTKLGAVEGDEVIPEEAEDEEEEVIGMPGQQQIQHTGALRNGTASLMNSGTQSERKGLKGVRLVESSLDLQVEIGAYKNSRANRVRSPRKLTSSPKWNPQMKVGTAVGASAQSPGEALLPMHLVVRRPQLIRRTTQRD